MPKAVLLLSGGLDSTLAAILLRRQGVEVLAVTFLTHFGCDITDSSSCSRDPFPAARRFGFQVKLAHLADKFIQIVKDPKYGHGKNMNPCIDCRILMLREAKELMHMVGAQFVATGEVLGQRPMSQRRECFPLMDREAGLEGLVLRPLSALALRPTVPELKGWVDRSRLCGIVGRSRKPQMALAEAFGLTDYPSPAGGCLLTEPGYSYRLRELLQHNPEPSMRELHMLRVGRHFRLSPRVKAVVGRNKEENARLQELYQPREDYLLRAEGCAGPLVVLLGEASQADVLAAASLCARYCDHRHLGQVLIRVQPPGQREPFLLTVAPATAEQLEALRVQAPQGRPKGAGLRAL